MSDKVRVECYHPGGLMLRLFRPGYDDGTGQTPMVVDGAGVRLNGPSTITAGGVGNPGSSDLPGITEIDAAWWAAWVEQNAGKNPLYDAGVIRLVEEPAPENPIP